MGTSKRNQCHAQQTQGVIWSVYVDSLGFNFKTIPAQKQLHWGHFSRKI